MKKTNILSMLNKFAFTICAVLFLSACDEVPDGYLSDTIIYTKNPFNVPAGKTTYSEIPNLAGSSFPLKFELTGVKNEKGEPDTILTKLRDLEIWKSAYDPATDTTLALIKAKREIKKNQPTMELLSASGQLLFTEATAQVPAGKYTLSMKMSNSAGTKLLNDIVTIDIKNIPYTYQNQNHNIAATNSGWVEPGGNNAFDTKGVGITGATAKVTHNSKGPNKIHLIFKDKNGSPWNWNKKEMVKRGDRPCLEYALPYVKGVFADTELVYEYPFAPFPIGKIVTPGGNIWENRLDYRILSDFVAIDGLTPGKWHCNLVFYFTFNLEGEWTFELTFPNLTRIPSL
jgi:hypothetical protein